MTLSWSAAPKAFLVGGCVLLLIAAVVWAAGQRDTAVFVAALGTAGFAIAFVMAYDGKGRSG